jgi:hypothetical protein
MADLLLTFAFGVAGYGLKVYGWPRVAFVIAFVLAGLFEINLHLTLQMQEVGRLNVLDRPALLVLSGLLGLTVVWPWVGGRLRRGRRRERRGGDEAGQEGEVNRPTPASATGSAPATARGPLVSVVLVAGAVGVFLVQTLTLAPLSRLAPMWVILPTGVLVMVELVRELARSAGGDGPAPRDGGRELGGGPAARRALRLGLWGAFLVFMTYVFGFRVAAPLFLAAYLRVEAGLSWKRAAVLTGLVAAVLFLVFGRWLSLTLPVGLLAG